VSRNVGIRLPRNVPGRKCTYIIYLVYGHTMCRSYPPSGGPGSVVGIATGYGLDRPGIESGRGFRACPERPWGPPSLLYNGYRVFPGVKSGRGVTLASHLLLVPLPRKGRAIPLLILWAIRPVQSLSACARCTLIYYPPSANLFLNTLTQC
jgi:hypothetical protein